MSYSGSETQKQVSDLGNQHSNGPHQDQIFDNPSTLCLAMWAKNQIRLGGADSPNRLLWKEYNFLSLSLFSFSSPFPGHIYSV